MKKLLAIIFSVSILMPTLAFAQTNTSVPAIPSVMVHTYTGSVQSVSGMTITLTNGNTVDATNAKLYRKYGSTMQITDIQNGDSLQIKGTISGNNITASTIIDLSLQAKNASSSGSVTAVNGSSFTLQASSKGTQTVNTSASTVFKKNGQTDSNGLADIMVGTKVSVSGVWDNTNNIINASTVDIIVKTKSVTGIFSSLSGNIISMTAKNSSSTVYSVDTTNAKLIRRYGATMQLSDFQSGDTLTVTGTVNGTNITAKTIRDESLQAHNGTFVGTVGTVSGNSFTLQSKNRGTQTINVTGSTIFKVGTASGSLSSIMAGQTVTVSGVWDRTNTNVTATRVSVKVSTMSVSGTLQAISGSSLTVANASTTYSVDASTAKIRFEHGHSGSLSNFQVNDQVKVWGKMVSGTTNITATIVQDMSRTYKNASSTPAQ